MSDFAKKILFGDDTREIYKIYTKNPNCINIIIDGKTPLQNAIINNNQSVVDFFLTIGSDINNTSDENQTVLHHLCYYMHDNITLIEKALELGADGNIQDDLGQTPLHISAMYTMNPNIIYLLSEKSNPNIHNDNDETPLLAACKNRTTDYNNMTVIDALIVVTDNIDQQDEFGNTALILAVKQNWIDPVEKLLDKGANPYIQNDDEGSALFYSGREIREIMKSRGIEEKYIYFPELNFW